VSPLLLERTRPCDERLDHEIRRRKRERQRDEDLGCPAYAAAVQGDQRQRDRDPDRAGASDDTQPHHHHISDWVMMGRQPDTRGCIRFDKMTECVHRRAAEL
jgi:hypothetical protein